MRYENKKTILTLPVDKFGLHNPNTHIATNGYEQAGGFTCRLVHSYGMRYAEPDSWIGIDNLFYSQGASRLIIL